MHSMCSPGNNMLTGTVDDQYANRALIQYKDDILAV